MPDSTSPSRARTQEDIIVGVGTQSPLDAEPTTFLTAREIATLLGTTVRRVYDMTNSGEIPYYSIGRRKKYIAEEVLAAIHRPVQVCGTLHALRGGRNVSTGKHLRVEAVRR